MEGTLKRKGTYEIYTTRKEGHHVLMLDEDRLNVLSEEGSHVITCADTHDKEVDLLEVGTFYLADFDEDEYDGVPHLLLETTYKFREAIFPNGLPSAEHKEKPVIITEEPKVHSDQMAFA